MYGRNETLRAMGRMMARYAQSQDFDADLTIEAAPLLKEWKKGSMEEPASYIVGDVRTFDGQPWRCAQAHVHYGEDGWDPAKARALWAPYHATKRECALPWVTPTSAEDAYNTGEWMIWTDGAAYQALRDAVVHGPDVLADAWQAEA